MSEESQALPEKRVNWREQLDTEVRLYQQNRWDVETAKIARLKSLRLARDAENQSALPAARPKHASKKRSGDKHADG